MIKTILFIAFVIATTFLFGQNIPQQYINLIKKADSLYKAKDYGNSAFTYSDAFKINNLNLKSNDLYNAACSWALANYPDSAFSILNQIVTKMNYINYGHITIDADLKSLHNDKRWEPLLETVKANKNKSEANLNKPLVKQLDSIYTDDQKYRIQIDEIGKKFGYESKEMKALWKIVNEKDSINLIEIKNILEKYGWLGEDVIGNQGNLTLFLVIQHSDLATQEKYLPMMREAVKKGKASGGSLAMLEDRVALRQGKRQIYGNQIGRDPDTNLRFVLPLDDPDNVDKRRAEVGLGLFADYLNHFQIKWDVEQYKKDLPTIEAKLKAQQK